MKKMSGKGSKPRPISNREQFEKNWDTIFGKKDYENTKCEGEGTKTPTVGERQTS
jgi:hypothetical protein